MSNGVKIDTFSLDLASIFSKLDSEIDNISEKNIQNCLTHLSCKYRKACVVVVDFINIIVTKKVLKDVNISDGTINYIVKAYIEARPVLFEKLKKIGEYNK